MKPLISVIIPFYHGEKYIENCLDSIRKQNYPALEVLVVDDGSGEESREIVAEYGKKYSMNITIIPQENQGQGAARNTGMREAGGKYLCFVDQDDTLAEGILEKMADRAEKEKADIVSAGYRRVTTEGKVKQEIHLKDTRWSQYRVITPWSKLYLREFIEAHKISFLPVVLGEDIYFLIQAYAHGPKVAFLKDIGYNWLDNAVSVSNTEHKKLTAETSLLNLYDRLEKLEGAESLKKEPLYEYFLMKTAIWDILYTAGNNPYESVAANSERIWKWFDKHFPEYEKNPYVRPHKPEGEGMAVRLVIWGYLLLKKLHFEKILLRVISK